MSEVNIEEQRQKKIKIFSLVSIAAFLAILVLPTLIWGIGMLVAGESFRALDYDLGENRNKADFPAQFTSAYGTEVEAYYNDRLPFRAMIISANRELTAEVEEPYNEIISPYLIKVFYHSYAADDEPEFASDLERGTVIEKSKAASEIVLAKADGAEETGEENGQDIGAAEGENDNGTAEEVKEDGEETLQVAEGTYMPPRLFNNTTIEGRDGWLFYAKDNALEDYLGTNILTDAQMNQYVDGMVRLQEICNAQGKQLYFIILPNKEIVYSEKMPSYTIANEYRRVERLIDYIHANSNVKIIYPVEELKAAKAEGQLYYKTDTHWTQLGAFIGVQALYSMMGMPVTDVHSLSIKEVEYLDGDLIRMGNLNQEDYHGDIGYQVSYKPGVTVESVDGSRSGDGIYTARSTSANQCNIVVIGDSFRDFMSWYITRDFSNYTHVHWQCLEEPTAKEAFQNADIIVIESVERADHTLLNTLPSVANTLQP